MSWNKDVSQLESLAAALAVLRQIPMKHMRHGRRRLHCFPNNTNSSHIHVYICKLAFTRQVFAVCCGHCI